MRRVKFSLATNRHGNIVALTALLLPVMLIIAAMAINIAYLQLTRTELMVATDAASRAGGRAISNYQNIRGVIAGHAHEHVETFHGNAVIITTPATSPQAWHAQPGESSDPDDFWASHRFDPTKFGYRMIDLSDTGDLSTFVRWIVDVVVCQATCCPLAHEYYATTSRSNRRTCNDN